MENSVVIVGGGIAGLTAARELIKRNFKVKILEARSRFGGRIFSELTGSTVIENGAEFVHGNLPGTFDLIREYGLSAQPVEGEFINLLSPEDDVSDNDWDRFIKKMKSLREDISLKSFIEKYFGDEGDWAIRNYAISFAEGFDLADPETASTIGLCNEWSEDDEKQFRINGGYKTLVEAIYFDLEKKGCALHPEHAVKHIHWEKNNVEISTVAGQKFNANKVILTIPAGVWKSRDEKSGYISFSPSIDDYIKDFDRIGFGSVIKIVLHFKSAFWLEHYKNAGFFFTNSMIRTWWTQSPLQNNILTGWVGGPAADGLKKSAQGNLLQAALKSLSDTFSLSIEWLQNNLILEKITDWDIEPYTNGGYTFPSLGSDEFRKRLAVPIEDTIYFAGEALDISSSPGTVEAAIISGQNCARKIQYLAF